MLNSYCSILVLIFQKLMQPQVFTDSTGTYIKCWCCDSVGMLMPRHWATFKYHFSDLSWALPPLPPSRQTSNMKNHRDTNMSKVSNAPWHCLWWFFISCEEWLRLKMVLKQGNQRYPIIACLHDNRRPPNMNARDLWLIQKLTLLFTLWWVCNEIKNIC